MGRLLLIDDDPALVARQARQVFPPPDHVVEVAESGADGVEAARRGRPGAVLLDLHLPDASGFEVFQAIRRIDARIPVIFITVARKADAAIEAMKQGAYDYLFKPLDLRRLREVVEGAFEVSRRMRTPAVVAEDGEADVSDESGTARHGRLRWRSGGRSVKSVRCSITHRFRIVRSGTCVSRQERRPGPGIGQKFDHAPPREPAASLPGFVLK